MTLGGIPRVQRVKKPWALPKPTNFFEKKLDKKLLEKIKQSLIFGEKRSFSDGSRVITLAGL